jgi:hypothetical protein
MEAGAGAGVCAREGAAEASKHTANAAAVTIRALCIGV